MGREVSAGAGELGAYADAPEVLSIVRSVGVAGNYALTARVRYGDEVPSSVAFHSSSYGGGVVMVTESGVQCFVARSVRDRIGDRLTVGWVHRFFGVAEESGRD